MGADMVLLFSVVFTSGDVWAETVGSTDFADMIN